MILRKLGCALSEKQFGEFSSHAQVPTPVVLGPIIRVYFAARSRSNKSYVTYADFDRQDPLRLLKVKKEPVLEVSLPGTFDEDGTMPGHVLHRDDRLWMYFTGWNQKVTSPYHNAIGLAESMDGGESFKRKFIGPIMDRTAEEPFIAVTPFIVENDDGFRCWYNSGTSWRKINDKHEAVYVVKEARSSDGIEWRRIHEPCFPLASDDEAISHPTVFQTGTKYHMLFSVRGLQDYRTGPQAYRMGYASSEDGAKWFRDDDAVSFAGRNEDWDSKMQCYPFYLNLDGRSLVYYNGNGFGQTGFGLAEVE